MKKVIILLTVLTMIFCSCGPKSEKTDKTNVETKDNEKKETGEEVAKVNDAEPGWKKDTSPIKFDWYFHADWYVGPDGDDLVSKYITEKTGVSFNITIPQGEPNEYLNSLIVGDNLPDILTLGWWEPQYSTIQDDGMVYALNELADKYDPYFYKVTGEGSRNWYTHADGNLYCYPNHSLSPDLIEKVGNVETTSNQNFLVRKDIYEAIGKPDMRTPEGFLKGLQLAMDYSKEKGLDMVPMYFQGYDETLGCYGLEAFLQNLLAIPTEKNGKLYNFYSDPEYIRWLKTFREAFEKGLITQDPFIDEAPKEQARSNAGGYFAMIRECTSVQEANTILYQKDPNSVYIAIDGPANSKLDKPRLRPQGTVGGWMVTMISKNCKNPERALSFLTYLISEEGQRDIFFGKKGETWDTIDGVDKLLPKYEEMYNKDLEKFQAEIGAHSEYWMLRNPLYYEKWEAPKPAYMQDMLDWTKDKVDLEQMIYSGIPDPAVDSQESIILGQLRQLRSKTFVEAIMAKSEEEFDKIWNEFLKKQDTIGYQKYLDYNQKIVDKNKKFLGYK